MSIKRKGCGPPASVNVWLPAGSFGDSVFNKVIKALTEIVLRANEDGVRQTLRPN